MAKWAKFGNNFLNKQKSAYPNADFDGLVNSLKNGAEPNWSSWTAEGQRDYIKQFAQGHRGIPSTSSASTATATVAPPVSPVGSRSLGGSYKGSLSTPTREEIGVPGKFNASSFNSNISNFISAPKPMNTLHLSSEKMRAQVIDNTASAINSGGMPINSGSLKYNSKPSNYLFDRSKLLNETISGAYGEYEGVVSKGVINDFRKNVDVSSYKGAKTKEEFVSRVNGDIEKNEIARRANEKIGGRTLNASDSEVIYNSARSSFLKDLERSRKPAGGSSSSVSSSRSIGVDVIDGAISVDEKIVSGLNPGQKYAMNKAINKYNSVEQMVKKGGMDDIVRKQMGLKEDADFQAFKGLDSKGRAAQYQQGINSAIEKPGMLNAAMGYKVPHMAMGALGTAGLVSAMSSSRGQQTNSQLYGQQQPYY